MGFAAKQTLVTAPPRKLGPMSLQPPPHSREVGSGRGEPAKAPEGQGGMTQTPAWMGISALECLLPS